MDIAGEKQDNDFTREIVGLFERRDSGLRAGVSGYIKYGSMPADRQAVLGDCNLRELKKLYGDRIVLKGNLHTTEVMLRGSVETVRAAARKSIDDAGKGGRFILSTGDQCGRDTPDENSRVLVDTARTYGRYK